MQEKPFSERAPRAIEVGKELGTNPQVASEARAVEAGPPIAETNISFGNFSRKVRARHLPVLYRLRNAFSGKGVNARRFPDKQNMLGGVGGVKLKTHLGVLLEMGERPTDSLLNKAFAQDSPDIFPTGVPFEREHAHSAAHARFSFKRRGEVP